MSARRVSRRDLLSLVGLARAQERSPEDAASGTVRAGAVFSLEAFYAERKRQGLDTAPPPQREEASE